ncbi:BMC domain-containing protein [Ammoniphilus sp. CFH 90114]|uniref:BMC domain-containing protein n=1 Tax=Ammoniphilus sp. CFH 90114 TaxID=2493665 RepID=UPI00100E934D|nr:BMC domain-containing protein [Ammoniphilus sp. CFH 90114]RXT05770.1 BMC domain-containing protein [Ammoniphilus sp. CFH 90114]
MEAIGMVEMRGLVPAIEALDAMTKAANVRLIDLKVVGSGLVCVIITGDVSAVKAAVDIGKTVHTRTGGELIAENVIPRPHPELEKML